MTRCLKYTINLLLILVAFQIFNLNTAECTASVNDGSVTADHALTYVAKKCWDHTFDHFYTNTGNQGHDHHHKSKTWKKFFPGSTSVITPGSALALMPGYASIQHYTAITGYQFLYFRTINPPPPKVS